MINADSSNLAQFDNADEFDNTGCFYDNNKLMYTKVCVSSYTDKKDDKVWHAGRRHQTCPAASDGQQFGAGGGGGTVGDIPGVFGKGGQRRAGCYYHRMVNRSISYSREMFSKTVLIALAFAGAFFIFLNFCKLCYKIGNLFDSHVFIYI